MARQWRFRGVTAGTRVLLPLLLLVLVVPVFAQSLGTNPLENLGMRFSTMMQGMTPLVLAGVCAVIGIAICFNAMQAGRSIGQLVLGITVAVGGPGLVAWLR